MCLSCTSETSCPPTPLELDVLDRNIRDRIREVTAAMGRWRSWWSSMNQEAEDFRRFNDVQPEPFQTPADISATVAAMNRTISQIYRFYGMSTFGRVVPR